MVHQFITTSQMHNFNIGRYFCHDSKLGVHNTSLVDNDVFSKRLLPVSHDQRSSHDSLSLWLYFCRAHGIPLIVQHLPAWRLQPQALVAGKTFAAVKLPQNLMVTLTKNRNVLAADATIEMAGLCCNICGPSHKRLTYNAPHAFLIL